MLFRVCVTWFRLGREVGFGRAAGDRDGRVPGRLVICG